MSLASGAGTRIYRGIVALVTLFLCGLLMAPLAFATEEGESGSQPASSDASQEASLDAIAGLEDGTYQIELTMTGGSGKASVESPAVLEIEKGKPYVTLVWSSEHYDYMLVDGKKVTPVTTNPTSTFRVPVLAFDEAYEMVGDTTAMGEPHEITYEFTFDSSTIKTYPAEQVSLPESQAGSQEDPDIPSTSKALDGKRASLLVTVVSLVVAAIAIGLTIGLLLAYRQRN